MTTATPTAGNLPHSLQPTPSALGSIGSVMRSLSSWTPEADGADYRLSRGIAADWEHFCRLPRHFRARKTVQTCPSCQSPMTKTQRHEGYHSFIHPGVEQGDEVNGLRHDIKFHKPRVPFPSSCLALPPPPPPLYFHPLLPCRRRVFERYELFPSCY